MTTSTTPPSGARLPSEDVHVGLIWAQAAGGVIGADGRLPWHLPEDLAHFAATTRGRPVVMGRKTWESLPERVRPLPGRVNVVISGAGVDAPGAVVVGSVDEALDTAGPGRCWVIGGASVYAAAVPHAELAVVTEIRDDFGGDTYAPELGVGWVADDPAPDWRESRTGLGFRVLTWRRQAR